MTGPRACASAVTELSQDALVGSSLENGTTMLTCALRQHDFQEELGTKATRCWRKAASHVDGHARSTCHHPMTYRCIGAQGSSVAGQHPRMACTPECKGVSTSQPMRTSVIRLACSLAVVCGVSRRPLALLLAALCLRPMTQSSSTRWLADRGTPGPTPEKRLQPRLACPPATAWPRDGADPLGPDHGGMVVKEAQDRIRMTPEAASEPGAAARPWLPQGPDQGLHVPAVFADDAPRFP